MNYSQELLENKDSAQNAVNHCNQYFASVGTRFASHILEKLSATQESLADSLNLKARCTNSLFLSATDPQEVCRLISDLKSDSAPGIDSFTPVLLKHIKDAIAEPLAHIYNLSMVSGVFPDCWKTAIVCPIHKSGPKDVVDNYRPISLLCILSKILEKIVNKRLVDFLEKYNLLSDRQFGFRRSKSTEDAVQLLTETLVSHMDEGRRNVGVFLDLAKAFDTVSVPILLKKLESFGVRGNTLAWFSSYLSNRQQCVRVGEQLSTNQTISFGVPQGGNLSPTLFTIYMDDVLRMEIPNANLICYADDTVAIFHGRDWQSAMAAAENGLSTISYWLDHNLLTLNVKKTKFVGFHINRATKPVDNLLRLHAGNCHALSVSSMHGVECSCSCIDRVDSVKYLGIVLDQNLTFRTHIHLLSKRVRKVIFLMKTLRVAASVEVRKLVYVSMCQSLLQYCIGVWGGAAKSLMLELERAQRAVLKVMLSKPRRYPTDKLYQEAEVLNVRQLFVQRAVSKTHSNALDPSLLRKRPRPKRVQLPNVKTVFACRLPKYSHASTYNALCKHCDLQECSHRKARAKVKKWLMTQTYDETEALVKVYDK